MPGLAILGATGSLGSHVVRGAIAAGHDVSVFVRTPSRLPSEVARAVTVATGDLLHSPVADIAAFVAGHAALISCAGLVTEGAKFVQLVDRVVSAVESLEAARRPSCWFLAGAGVLQVGETRWRGVDLPKIRTIYWPHRENFERLSRSPIEWRLLCPGPMVEGAPLGIDRLRVSVDALPVPIPSWARLLPRPLLTLLFATRVPEMIIPYADAAAFILANLAPGGQFSRRRVGLALPEGMKGRKRSWTAQPRRPSVSQ